ncbi:MAG TPA: long-chain fatty acid--CoA ligase [Nocardioidaceae bacterium]|nr:long-chain fatty acid--CoA ligase [Nocardioidaceae bacterium]
MLNLSVLLEDSARNVPDRDAVVFGEMRLTYAQVDAMANQVANLLVSRGVRPGEKVALSCPNLPYFPIVYFGILKAGAVVVPLNVLLKAREIAYHLDDSDAVTYLCFEGTAGLPMGARGWQAFQETAGCRRFLLITADPSAPSPIDGAETMGGALAGQPATFESVATEATDTAVILYTSGTTGQPKGAELTHANMTLNAQGTSMLHTAPAQGYDVSLVALPLFHSFGQTCLMNTGFYEGDTLVLLARFDARAAIDAMLRHRVTVFAGVPTMYWGMLGALSPDDDVDAIATNLQTAFSGGASLPVEIIKEFKARFHVNIQEGYGLSETSPVATFSPPDRPPRPGTVGIPIWGVQAKLVDGDWNEVTGNGEVGEIAIRGHNIMKGYYKRPEATAEVLRDGWFRTGDLGTRDADGYFSVVDRSKDMVIRGGYNVYPREVEEVLMTHPAVSLAAVVGVPDEQYGEEVKAFIIKRKDVDVSEDQLVAWSREQMASYKYPRLVEFRDELPMTATGKILKRELR